MTIQIIEHQPEVVFEAPPALLDFDPGTRAQYPAGAGTKFDQINSARRAAGVLENTTKTLTKRVRVDDDGANHSSYETMLNLAALMDLSGSVATMKESTDTIVFATRLAEYLDGVEEDFISKLSVGERIHGYAHIEVWHDGRVRLRPGSPIRTVNVPDDGPSISAAPATQHRAPDEIVIIKKAQSAAPDIAELKKRAVGYILVYAEVDFERNVTALDKWMVENKRSFHLIVPMVHTDVLSPAKEFIDRSQAPVEVKYVADRLLVKARVEQDKSSGRLTTSLELMRTPAISEYFEYLSKLFKDHPEYFQPAKAAGGGAQSK